MRKQRPREKDGKGRKHSDTIGAEFVIAEEAIDLAAHAGAGNAPLRGRVRVIADARDGPVGPDGRIVDGGGLVPQRGRRVRDIHVWMRLSQGKPVVSYIDRNP